MGGQASTLEYALKLPELKEKLGQMLMGDIVRNIQASKILFEVNAKTGILVSTTQAYWDVITHIKHPVLKGKEKDVQRALCEPDEIRISKKDRAVLLFYRKVEKHHLCVVVRFLKKRGFIVTAYLTDKIKEGQLKWKR